MPIKFSEDCISSDSIDTSTGLKPGEIHLLENLRFTTKKLKMIKNFQEFYQDTDIFTLMMPLVQHIDHMHLMLVSHHTLNTLALVGLCIKN